MAVILNKEVVDMLDKMKGWEIRRKDVEKQLAEVMSEGEEIRNEILALANKDRMAIRDEIVDECPQNFFWMAIEFSKFEYSQN